MVSLGLAALVTRFSALVQKRDSTIADLRTQLATSQAGQVDPADIQSATDLTNAITAEEAVNP